MIYRTEHSDRLSLVAAVQWLAQEDHEDDDD